ncbi:putative ribonuclease H-like domain-containing protein [Tanacetum coccineum]
MAEQDTPLPTITAMKIPIIKKGEYDIWSMRMRQYICHTDHNLWDIIVDGDLQEEVALAGEQPGPPAPKTAKQLTAKRNQERVKSILLLAIPDEYLLKFHNVPDAKSLWAAIKSRFGGNDESKKMQRNVLKHQFENFTTAPNESLDKAYDRFQKLISQLEVHVAPVSKEDINQKFLRRLPPSWSQIALIMRNKPDIDQIDIDDLYNNPRVYKDEMKRSSSSTSNTQNLAFLSSENTSSTNEVSTASGDFGITSPQLENENLQQINEDDLEELDLRWQVAMLIVRVKKFIQKTRRNLDFKGKQPVGFDKRNEPTNESSSQALVAQDGLGGYDWRNDFDIRPVNYALMAISYSSSSSSSDNEVQNCSKQCLESFKTLQKNFDSEREKHSRARLEIQGYELALESLKSRIIGHEKNELAWGEKYEFQNYELKCREVKINNLKMELEKVVKERDELKVKIEKWEESSKSLNKILNSQMSANDKNGLGYGTLLNEINNKSETDSEISMSVFEVRSSDEEITLANDRFSKADGYHVVPPPITENFLTPRADISFAGLDEYAIRKKIIESKIAELNTDTSKSKTSETVVSPVKTIETQTVRNRVDKIGQISQKEGIGFKKIKACFVCKSTNHLIKDYDFYGKKSPEPKLKTVVNTARRTFVPSAVLTRTGLINPVRTNGKRAVHTISTTRSISTARLISTARPVGTARPAVRPKDLKQDVKIYEVKNMTTDGTRAVVSTSKGNLENFLQNHAVVDSGCSSHMTGNKAYLSNYKDYNGGFVDFRSDPKRDKITGKGKIRTANLDFDDVYFVDELKFNLFSVSQMCDKKNSVLFTDTECLIMSPSFKLLDESQVVLRAPRQNGVYTLDLKNIVPSGGITCLYAYATTDESKLWHRRLGHVNFKNINKLVKGHLVRGLPSKNFVNDHTCVACKKGKQHKASCKAKLERTIRKPLELLHMDLFGPVSVESINKKKYCLVVTDDFSRFSWVFFLATKDETNEILYKFITGLENQLNHKVKIIRSDHGTEFKNHAMNEFCAKKGIKREFSVARTPQQNGVAERKNRTLIEAARTMLADSLLPIPFWAEAVNTACYVLNRVLVTKPQNKTPYELLIGKPPSISFMRPFGCPLTILNTLDPLGKFDGKSDEGYLLGYSTTSKAFRVYNKRTKRVEENMHIDFLEDQPNVAGSGPDWMFDLDFLTNTMNYIPVSVENQVNVDAGTQEHYVAGSSEKDKEPTQEYILLPLHPHRPRISVEDVVQEKPSENFPKDNDVHDSEDVAEKEEQHTLTEAEQALKDDLERMIAQEIAAKAIDDATRQAFEEEKKRAAQATSINKLNTGRPSVSACNSPLVSTVKTPYASAASTPTSANTSGSSFVYLRGQIPIDASTLPNADLPIDPNIHDLEDDSNAFPNDG